MSIADQFLHKSLIQFKQRYDCQEAFFSELNQRLSTQGYVEESYLSNIISRENIYPTGLVTSTINIAIPHTDPQHIKKPFIDITKLNSPLTFIEMGSTDKKVDVTWIFALGVTNGANQVELLQKLMRLCSHQTTINKLQSLTDIEEIYQFFSLNIDL